MLSSTVAFALLFALGASAQDPSDTATAAAISENTLPTNTPSGSDTSATSATSATSSASDTSATSSASSASDASGTSVPSETSASPAPSETAGTNETSSTNETQADLPWGNMKDIRPWADEFADNTGCAVSDVKWTCVRATNYYYPAAAHIASYGNAMCDALETNNTLTLRHETGIWNIQPQNMSTWNNETGLSYTGINMARVSEEKKVRYNFWAYSVPKNGSDSEAGPQRWYGCRNAVAALWENCFAATETPGGYIYQFGTWEDGTEAYRITVDYLNHTEPYNAPTGINTNTSAEAFKDVPAPWDTYMGNMTQSYDFGCKTPLRPIPKLDGASNGQDAGKNGTNRSEEIDSAFNGTEPSGSLNGTSTGTATETSTETATGSSTETSTGSSSASSTADPSASGEPTASDSASSSGEPTASDDPSTSAASSSSSEPSATSSDPPSTSASSDGYMPSDGAMGGMRRRSRH